MRTILSIIETPRHPKFSALYEEMQFQEDKVSSIRKANTYLKRNCPDIIIAEFFYGYGSNYSGVHISNLDMLFVTLQKYTCEAKVIALVDKEEQKFIPKLEALYPLYQNLTYPIGAEQMVQILESTNPN